MIITETQQILVGKSYKNFRKGGGVCGVRLREVGRGMSIAGGAMERCDMGMSVGND